MHAAAAYLPLLTHIHITADTALPCPAALPGTNAGMFQLEEAKQVPEDQLMEPRESAALAARAVMLAAHCVCSAGSLAAFALECSNSCSTPMMCGCMQTGQGVGNAQDLITPSPHPASTCTANAPSCRQKQQLA